MRTGGVREIQRRETRARLFDAALVEIGKAGLVHADVTAIATAAGVVRGTFYSHFPTKEHVLVELELSEEIKTVAELRGVPTEAGDLETFLSLLVCHVLASERRLGPVVFRDMLGLHFSSSRPGGDELAQHPLVGFVADAIADAQTVGRIPADADTGELAVFFLTGMFALLAMGAHASAADDAALSRYVTTIVKGMETR